MAPHDKEQRHDSLNSPNVVQTALGPGKYEQSTHASDLGNLQDADEALQAVGNNGYAEEIAIDEEMKTRLLRKIDLHIMPIMCVVYGLNYLDKTTLSYASIMGLETDLDLTKSNYQWLGSIFYIGYLGFEYPTSRLLQRLPLAKYSAFNIILWGLTLSCTAATSNFAGIASVRLILGIFEAAVTPGFVLFTSQWYTKKEQGFRTGIWFSFNGFANVLGGLVAYGVAQGTSGRSLALASWKILFLVWGLITIVTGIIFLLVMPDSPLKARFLERSEGRLVIERTRHNQQGEDFSIRQLLLAFLLIVLILRHWKQALQNISGQSKITLSKIWSSVHCADPDERKLSRTRKLGYPKQSSLHEFFSELDLGICLVCFALGYT